jgi:hypothetical protein
MTITTSSNLAIQFDTPDGSHLFVVEDSTSEGTHTQTDARGNKISAPMTSTEKLLFVQLYRALTPKPAR